MVVITAMGSNNWVAGTVNNGEYKFEAKVFDVGSQFGIDGGRVSKLFIQKGNTTGWEDVVVNYDRGWDIEPVTTKQHDVYLEVLRYLENMQQKEV